jgi:pimeloyl-ACP methyl ester carboxylesterase
MGCQASVDLAVAKPDRVAGLVLVGPTVDPRARSLRSQTARLVLDSLREPLRLDAVVLSDYARVGPRRTLRSARVMLAHRLEERLPLLRVPTLVVRGERDPIVPKEWAEEAAGLVPDGRLVVVPGAAHCAHFTHPEAVARAIADFLASPGQV